MQRSDLLCINYNEALYLSKLSNPSLDDIAKCILDMGVKSLIIKRGEEGASFFDNQNNFYKIIFNGSRNKFLKTMANLNYEFETNKKIWVVK